MTLRLEFDADAVARAARAHSVERLRVFGSAVSERFDPVHSDVDVLVDFLPGTGDVFGAYFDLKDELERIFRRPVDLVMSDAVVNPHVRRRVLTTAEDLYAA